jgi:hypothetical protein
MGMESWDAVFATARTHTLLFLVVPLSVSVLPVLGFVKVFRTYTRLMHNDDF